MANNHSNLTSLFTDIADAIRAKTGSSDPIVADQFPEAIEGISGGGADDGFPIGDGNTHIWLSISEGRMSPILGLYPNGTVTGTSITGVRTVLTGAMCLWIGALFRHSAQTAL